MRYLSVLLSLLLILQFNLLTTDLAEAAVSVTPGGITGQLPVTKVGALLAADSLAILNGTEIKIQPKDKDKKHNPGKTQPGKPAPSEDLLSGILLQTKTDGGAATGYAVFNGGERFHRINPRACPEKVITVSGTTYVGQITSFKVSGLTISTDSGSHDIAANDIAELHSGLAFKYNISNYGNAEAKMSLTPTCIHAVAAVTKDSHEGRRVKKLIIVGMALTIVAVAITVPVAIAASHHHHNNQNNYVIANLLATKQQAVPQPILPAAMHMPTPQQLGQTYLLNLQQSSSGSSNSLSTHSFNVPVPVPSTTSTTATVLGTGSTSTSGSGFYLFP